jgi:hypothetical protein
MPLSLSTRWTAIPRARNHATGPLEEPRRGPTELVRQFPAIVSRAALFSALRNGPSVPLGFTQAICVPTIWANVTASPLSW